VTGASGSPAAQGPGRDREAALARIGVIDYGMGNRRSVQKALEHVGASVVVTDRLPALEACDGLVLPGVGAFPAAMRNLRARALDGFILDAAGAGRPLLGICLGMQLLFERSVEGEPTAGLGLMPGEVTWLDSRGQRLPHIGWNEVRFRGPCALTDGLPPGGCPFYHVHSLVARPAEADHIVGSSEYGERFTTLVAAGNVFGAQFHPEKSSTRGLALLRAYLTLCSGVPAGTMEGRA
jgi:glutamine amidotransferase